jgi:hypothetical protein
VALRPRRPYRRRQVAYDLRDGDYDVSLGLLCNCGLLILKRGLFKREIKIVAHPTDVKGGTLPLICSMVHCNFFVNAVYDHYHISELRLSDCSRARLNFQAFDVDAVVATI